MGTMGQSVTLANSIIGVGILAMPFCFQQCGIVLATLILLFMGLVSRLCCHLLLKSALIARRRSFEFLAFHTFGPVGKLAVEVGIIGFLMGTCIAYFVVVGDLGPQIISKMFNINQSDILRTSIMVLVSLVCVLPLGLLRNVDSLSNVSAATIGFYFCLVIKVISEAASCMWRTDWQSRVLLWRPDGFLQCVPIFSMALFCQTQLFEIFESLPTLSLEKMNKVTQNAIHICTGVYFTLGLFGYIAFHSQDISGNILMSLSPTMASDVIKLGFVMSLAFSFPLVIFPCRASLYSFLYKKIQAAHHDHMINNSIPTSTFRCITVAIIAVALFISLLIPNIELVLGLLGSTIGVLICVVFPAACFVNLTFKDTNERILAKGVIILGLIILVLGTYANLQAAESRVDRYEVDDRITPERIDKIVEDFFERMEREDGFRPASKTNLKLASEEKLQREDSKDSEIQPPNPVPPDTDDKNDKQNEPIQEKVNKIETNFISEQIKDTASETHPKNLKGKLNGAKINKESNGVNKNNEEIKRKSEENKIEEVKPIQDKAEEKIDIIKQQKLIETIKQHGEEQKELIKEQKEILDELVKAKKELQQNKKDVDTVEAKKLAVESIQKIANVAIKSLSLVTEPPKGEKKGEDAEVLEKIADEVKKAIEAIVETKEDKDEGNQKNKPNVAKTGAPSNGLNINSPDNIPQQNNPPQINIPNANQQALNTQNNIPVNNIAPVIPPVAQILNAPNISPQNNIPQPNPPVNIVNTNQQVQNIKNNIPNLNLQPNVNNFAPVNLQANNIPNIQNNVQISNLQPNVNNLPVKPQANPQMSIPNAYQQVRNIQNNIPIANLQPNVNINEPVQSNSDVNIPNANSQANVNNFASLNAQANPQMNMANVNQQVENIQNNNANLQQNVNNLPVNPQAIPQINLSNAYQQVQNIQNNIPLANSQLNVNNAAPVNPPVPQILNSPNIAHAEALAQNLNIPPIKSNQHHQVDSNVIHSVNVGQNNERLNVVQDQPEAIVNQNKVAQNVQTNTLLNIQQQVQNQPDKQNIETEIVKNNLNEEQINQSQLNSNLGAKPHLHSADEPQSYKVGEELQTAEMAKNVAENIPIPIALKGQIKAKQTELNNLNKEQKIELNNLNKEQNDNQMKIIQNVVNLHEENVASRNKENNAGHIRQKRDVVDCTEKSSLATEENEVCKTLLENNKVKTDKKETSIKKFEDEKLEISIKNNEFKSDVNSNLPSKVDLNEGLNRVPVDLIHHVRSLKSYEENEKR